MNPTDDDLLARLTGRVPSEWLVPPSEGFMALLGLDIRPAPEPDGGLDATLPVTPRLMQPMGILHGGVYAAVAESLASIATAREVIPTGRYGVGQANNTSFLRPISAGTMHVTCRARHRGRTSYVWVVEMRDDEERLCALTTVTMAVRERPV